MLTFLLFTLCLWQSVKRCKQSH